MAAGFPVVSDTSCCGMSAPDHMPRMTHQTRQFPWPVRITRNLGSDNCLLPGPAASIMCADMGGASVPFCNEHGGCPCLAAIQNFNTWRALPVEQDDFFNQILAELWIHVLPVILQVIRDLYVIQPAGTDRDRQQCTDRKDRQDDDYNANSNFLKYQFRLQRRCDACHPGT